MHGFETFSSYITNEILKTNKVNRKPTRMKEGPHVADRLLSWCVYRELLTG